MNKTFALTAVVLAALTLSGCAPGLSKDDPIKVEWKYTELGDVLCNVNGTTKDGYITDCDWNSLTSAHEQTEDDAPLAAGEWMWIEGYDIQVFCLTYSGGFITDCNYPVRNER